MPEWIHHLFHCQRTATKTDCGRVSLFKSNECMMKVCPIRHRQNVHWTSAHIGESSAPFEAHWYCLPEMRTWMGIQQIAIVFFRYSKRLYCARMVLIILEFFHMTKRPTKEQQPSIVGLLYIVCCRHKNLRFSRKKRWPFRKSCREDGSCSYDCSYQMIPLLRPISLNILIHTRNANEIRISMVL